MGIELSNGCDINNFISKLTHDLWAKLPVSGSRPLSRYKHGAVVADKHLYVVGGSCNGRYLCDVQALDLINMSWSTIKPTRRICSHNIEGVTMEEIPAISGHSMVKWNSKLLIVGGHTKDFCNNLAVRFLDLESHECGIMWTSGNIPVARGGHSVTLIGSRLLLFGGEDSHRQLLNDIFMLDLNTMIWDMVETRGISPAPRFDHVSAVHTDRYFLIFGGCSHSIFFNDLHVLDLDSLEWSKPQLHGGLVNPRAGHAGITIEEHWYILGGGDNKSGKINTANNRSFMFPFNYIFLIHRFLKSIKLFLAGDRVTIELNMSNLTLAVLTSVEGRHPLASEGLSVNSAMASGEKVLVTFGGYNGKYHNEVFVMKPTAKDSFPSRIIQSPAAAAAAASVAAAYAVGRAGSLSSPPIIPTNDVDPTAEITFIRVENAELESTIASTRAENSLKKVKIGEKSAYFEDLSKELISLRKQLLTETDRCSKLEEEIEEVRRVLDKLPSMEAEVRELQRQRSEMEKPLEVGRRRNFWLFST